MEMWMVTVVALARLVLPAQTVDGQERLDAVMSANTPAQASTYEEDRPLPAVGAEPQIIQRRSPQPMTRKSAAAGGRTANWSSGLGALVAVLLLIAGGAWLLKRYLPRERLGGGSTIQVLSRTALSPQQSLALVRVGKRVLVVGITSSHISHLTTFDDPVEVDLLVSEVGSGRSAGERFKNLLGREAELYDQIEPDGRQRDPAGGARVFQAREDLKGLLNRVKSLTGAARSG